MSPKAYYQACFKEHEEVVSQTQQMCEDDFYILVQVCEAALKAGNKLLFFGNGGSAADAQHIATEFTVRFISDRAPMAAIALTTDTSTLTAIGNDFGFNELFARQIRALGKPGDVAIGITTSGNSQNVLLGLEAAESMGIIPACLTGRDGGAVKDLANPCLIVPSDTTARIQEMHIMLGQMLCGILEQQLGLVS